MELPCRHRELAFSSIEEVSRLYRARELSPVDVADALLDRIAVVDPLVGSYVTIADETFRAQAKQAEQRLARPGLGPVGSLHGIPVSLKDNIATEGIRTTAGSRLLANWIPDFDAACVTAVRAAGGLVAGKVKLFEFAFGEAHEDYGHVRNPWSLSRSTGGSSTGSVASVAAGLCFGSIGTDTGGSIRVPAGLTGVVGLKPSYGRISTAGTIQVSPSLCHVGPVARTVGDVALLFDVLANEDCARSIAAGVEDLRVAIAGVQASEAIDVEVRAAFDAACGILESEGAALEPVDIPELLEFCDVLWAIASSEAAALHEDWLASHADDYHPVVRERLERGGRISASAYVRARWERATLAQRLQASLGRFDALLLPVAPITAYRLGARRVMVDGRDEEVSQAVTRYTSLASVTGRPALSVPCGFSSEGLPIGFQVVGPPLGEDVTLRIGRAYEQATAS